MPEFETRIRVRYAETDQMGVAYHANYLVWMEVARVEYCRNIGFDYRVMEQDGILIAVIEAHCRYLSPARFDDEIVIEIRVAESTPRLLRFRYDLRCLVDDRRIARGETMHLYLNKANFRPVRLPEKYQSGFSVTSTGTPPQSAP